MWAPCWPHELCYPGTHLQCQVVEIWIPKCIRIHQQKVRIFTNFQCWPVWYHVLGIISADDNFFPFEIRSMYLKAYLERLWELKGRDLKTITDDVIERASVEVEMLTAVRCSLINMNSAISNYTIVIVTQISTQAYPKAFSKCKRITNSGHFC